MTWENVGEIEARLDAMSIQQRAARLSDCLIAFMSHYGDDEHEDRMGYALWALMIATRWPNCRALVYRVLFGSDEATR